MKLTIGAWLKKYVKKTLTSEDETAMIYPPPIAKTLGFDLIDLGEDYATLAMQTDVKTHANPMGTIHGGVLCNLADAAIGTVHAATLQEGRLL